MINFMKANVDKIYVVGLREGDEVINSIINFAKENDLDAITFYGIGGFERVKLGFFRGQGEYDVVTIYSSKPKAIEVAPIVGSVIKRSTDDYHPHIHVSISYKNSDKIETVSAHLLEGIVYPLMELFVFELNDVYIDQLKKIFPHRFI